MNLSQLTKLTEDEAREYLEKLRWPEGAVCPHCGGKETVKLAGASTRPGVYKCKTSGCRKKFSVTVGTIFERSHVKLRDWLIAAHLIVSSKKGVSAHQVHRELGVQYKTAWFMCHRLRHAMAVGSFDTKLQGTVEADETYVGGKFRRGSRTELSGLATPNKTPVVALVERKGSVRAMVMPRVTSTNLRRELMRNVDTSATLMTDEHKGYVKAGRKFARHEAVKHSEGEYVRGDAYTNTVEGFFSLIKRGVYGNFHHVSAKHLHRYVDEFAFRHNRRKTTDGRRRDDMLGGIGGKRLTYR